MNSNIDLKKLERKAWTSYFDDGLFDLMFAIILITSVIRTVTDNAWFTLMMFSGVIIYILGKRFITVPRLGRVKFSSERVERQSKLTIILGIVFLITIGILVLSLQFDLPSLLSSIIMSIFIIVVFGIFSYLLEFNRMIIYGIMFAVSEGISGFYGETAGTYANLVFGIIAFCIACSYLIRFISNYPLPGKEVANAH
ncbi:MAG: hypothetical protein JSV49_07355 [Thermoplasmata archaeon]|nr:MAG: hypothetical protein JSV49_07355 [Thermoplasmata archaeon]